MGRPVALVTGGGGDIGRAIALRLARNGRAVAIVDIDEQPRRRRPRIWWRRLAARRWRSGPTFRVRSRRASFVDAVEARFGPIGIFANNAGIEGVVAPLHEYPDDVFDRLLQVNVKGVFLGLKYVLAKMIPRGTGAPSSIRHRRRRSGARRTVRLCRLQACGAGPDPDGGAGGGRDAHSESMRSCQDRSSHA